MFTINSQLPLDKRVKLRYNYVGSYEKTLIMDVTMAAIIVKKYDGGEQYEKN